MTAGLSVSRLARFVLCANTGSTETASARPSRPLSGSDEAVLNDRDAAVIASRNSAAGEGASKLVDKLPACPPRALATVATLLSRSVRTRRRLPSSLASTEVGRPPVLYGAQKARFRASTQDQECADFNAEWWFLRRRENPRKLPSSAMTIAQSSSAGRFAAPWFLV